MYKNIIKVVFMSQKKKKKSVRGRPKLRIVSVCQSFSMFGFSDIIFTTYLINCMP